ncbi:MAG: GAF domain-containing protein [Chloroflexaceae bacterium]|nr:GAF domain-containing protein [Chloroflexaceae bacterium]
MRSPYRALVLRIVFIYIVVSAVWIVLSDSLIFVLWADAAWIVQTSKGWLFVLFSGGILYFLLDHAMAERSRFEQELETYAHYQETVSALRQSALLKSEQNILFNQAVSLVALTLNTEYTSLFEHRVSEKQMVLRACTGWSDGLIGKTPFQASPGTLAHYVLQTNEPLLVNRLANDRRFTRAESYLQQHGITSTMQVAIMAETGQVFGILGAHTTGKRDFLPDECHFLQEIANVLAIAIGREQTEAALRVQKTILECQTEASLDGILVVDTQGIIRSINQRFRDMWRLPLHDQALSHALILEGIRAQLVDFDPFIQRIRDLVAQGDAQHHEEIVLRDGRVIDSYTAPVQDATGNYYGRVWYYRDITELRRTEATLREREEIFRRLVDSMDDIIFTLDCQQRHTGIFGRWLERYGIPASFFWGRRRMRLPTQKRLASMNRRIPEHFRVNMSFTTGYREILPSRYRHRFRRCMIVRARLLAWLALDVISLHSNRRKKPTVPWLNTRCRGW